MVTEGELARWRGAGGDHPTRGAPLPRLLPQPRAARAKEERPNAKTLLYLFRVVMTGIHLLRTGEVEANLTNLNRIFQRAFIDELIERKMAGAEKGTLEPAERDRLMAEAKALEVELEQRCAGAHRSPRKCRTWTNCTGSSSSSGAR